MLSLLFSQKKPCIHPKPVPEAEENCTLNQGDTFISVWPGAVEVGINEWAGVFACVCDQWNNFLVKKVWTMCAGVAGTGKHLLSLHQFLPTFLPGPTHVKHIRLPTIISHQDQLSGSAQMIQIGPHSRYQVISYLLCYSEAKTLIGPVGPIRVGPLSHFYQFQQSVL